MMQNTTKWIKDFVLFLLQMVALNNFILFIKYTIPQNQKGNSYAFKDFILDSVQTMTDPAQREDENDSINSKSKASTLMLPKHRRHVNNHR
jgi:hypothetical protein